MQSHSKTKGGLQDFASLTTLSKCYYERLQRFCTRGCMEKNTAVPVFWLGPENGIPNLHFLFFNRDTEIEGFMPFPDTKVCEQGDIRGLSKATCNQFQQLAGNLKKCDCKVGQNAKLLLGWELYKPRKFYPNTNQRSRSNSTDVLRRLLIDHITKTNAHGRPTALTRLIEGMKKPPPKPKYEYSNCLQQTLLFDDYKMQYQFGGKVTYSPPDIDEIYLNATGKQKPQRKNPFTEVQLCPTSLYNLLDQPLGQEYLPRGETLIDPKSWAKIS